MTDGGTGDKDVGAWTQGGDEGDNEGAGASEGAIGATGCAEGGDASSFLLREKGQREGDQGVGDPR